MDRFAGGIGAAAAEDFDPARGKFHRVGDDFNMLLVIQRGGFPRRSDRHNAVHARADLRADQPAERVGVNFAVLERRDNGRVSSSKHGEARIRANAQKSTDIYPAKSGGQGQLME